MKPRTIFYIDGYNWYHGVFKHHPEWKWLDIQKFCEALRPDDDVVAVKLFSALIDEPDARERQERYFKALRTLPKISIILGLFKGRDVTCRADCKKTYSVPEEKKTDVNIAVHLMADAFVESSEKIVVISGDSDLEPPLEWLCRNKPQLKISVHIPAILREQRDRRTDYYKKKNLKVDVGFLPLHGISQHQLKNAVLISEGTFALRPHSWKAT